MSDILIPKITDEELYKRYESIKPVVTVKGNLYYLRKFTLDEIKGITYIGNLEKDLRKQVDEDEIEEWEGKDFRCLHTFGHPLLFKPSIAEVLSQIKECDIPKVKAFEIIEYPRNISNVEQDSFSLVALKAGYHVSVVRLYKEKGKGL